MRIIHINCNYLNSKLHQNLIISLNKLKIENTVFVPTYDKNKSVVNVNKDVIVSECFKKWDRVNFFYKQRKIYKDIKEKVDISKYNVIHAYTLFTDGNCAYNLNKEYGIPYIVTIRNTDLNTFLKYMIHLRRRGIDILKKASKIVFLSKSYKDRLFNEYVPRESKKELEEKSVIIPNGIDDFWFKNKYEDKNISITLDKFKNKNLDIVYAGKIDKNKNLRLTIDSIRDLKEKLWDIKFHVAGKIVDDKLFNSIQNDIIYYGELKKEELLKLYRKSDIFIMPSHTETFGLVYVEAMSQGLPVIYTKGEGFDGQFIEGEVGFSTSDVNEKCLFNGIFKIINNYENIYKNLIKNAQRFTWKRIGNTYKCIYKDIIL
ncbi:MAG: glycosyltransferase family 4 protein [Peptoniphilus harei]|uniref:glycosyltransferase family 4 protein n=1 Tax=Peptoniphilus harei TaxID=54005 RepID=UPI002902F2AC|nr:glycosyltransferase family 4 protein [Peptoniphilus harei]MDU3086953.1 glycosyltransferase family 4 protein [Peptoniphilus harei]